MFNIARTQENIEETIDGVKSTVGNIINFASGTARLFNSLTKPEIYTTKPKVSLKMPLVSSKSAPEVSNEILQLVVKQAALSAPSEVRVAFEKLNKDFMYLQKRIESAQQELVEREATEKLWRDEQAKYFVSTASANCAASSEATDTYIGDNKRVQREQSTNFVTPTKEPITKKLTSSSIDEVGKTASKFVDEKAAFQVYKEGITSRKNAIMQTQNTASTVSSIRSTFSSSLIPPPRPSSISVAPAPSESLDEKTAFQIYKEGIKSRKDAIKQASNTLEVNLRENVRNEKAAFEMYKKKVSRSQAAKRKVASIPSSGVTVTNAASIGEEDSVRQRTEDASGLELYKEKVAATKLAYIQKIMKSQRS